MNYPITNIRQLEEDRALDLHEYIQENWEDIEAGWIEYEDDQALEEYSLECAFGPND